MRRFACLAGAISVAVALAGTSTSWSLGVSVRGNQLVNESGEVIRLLGVNRSGTEYACSKGFGLFDSPRPAVPDGPAMVGAIRAWNANAVRVPLNEACWLGTNGVKRRYAKRRYRTAIAEYVATLENAGIHPILDLHIATPRGYPARRPADELRPMPDRRHAVPFWRSVARRFGDDPAIVFDLFNEPHDVGWRCLRDGCRITRDLYDRRVPNYRAVGMQTLVDVVRRQGAVNVLLVPGVNWSGDLSRWREFRPHDPLTRVAASFHNYEGPELGTCHLECWNRTVAPVAEHVPVVTGEIGDVDCDHDYTDGYMRWADRRGISYLGWAWNATAGGHWRCDDGPALIVDYDGTPTRYGIGLRDHLRSLGSKDSGKTRSRAP